MRVLALDYGSARCGVAVCDPTETIVTPLEPVAAPGTRARPRRAARARRRARGRARRRRPAAVAARRATPRRRARRASSRAARAARLGEDVPVELHDERLTTRLAQRDAGSPRASEDSRAAAHLLEDWLARRRAGGLDTAARTGATRESPSAGRPARERRRAAPTERDRGRRSRAELHRALARRVARSPRRPGRRSLWRRRERRAAGRRHDRTAPGHRAREIGDQLAPAGIVDSRLLRRARPRRRRAGCARTFTLRHGMSYAAR